jgi:hypothetical protein
MKQSVSIRFYGILAIKTNSTRCGRPRKMDKEYYDLCYEAWRTGSSPDDISMDDWDYYKSRGYAPDEISLIMMRPEREPVEEVPDADKS